MPISPAQRRYFLRPAAQIMASKTAEYLTVRGLPAIELGQLKLDVARMTVLTPERPVISRLILS